MPSPFPGMDPYIEDPEIWGDFHQNLPSEIQGRINPLIRPRYVARLIPYTTYETVEIEHPRGIRPDVGVWEQQRAERMLREASAVLTPAPVTSKVELEFPLEIVRVEIQKRDTLELVTAIEILSPVNKRRGHPAFDDYLKKRRDLLYSRVHLIEIDLLRGGTRPPLLNPVPPAPYYVTLARAEYRPQVAVWPIQFQDHLPIIPIPLLQPDPDVPLDLQAAVAAVYERGGYADLIDYSRETPPPALTEAEAQSVEEYLRTARRD
ncbi:MAG: DUF4058 family protein [Chloroflexi bacterium]|nr:DUF4058 family protein [Chloroflexota bacterium]